MDRRGQDQSTHSLSAVLLRLFAANMVIVLIGLVIFGALFALVLAALSFWGHLWGVH